MRTHRLSGSKINLALHCAYSFRADVEVFDRPSGLAARLGTAAHGLIEDWFYKRDPRALEADVAEKAPRIAARMTEWLSPRRDQILYCEVGLRYDTENDRTELGPKRGEPGYEDVGQMVIPMTLDLAIRGADAVLDVIDVKTGQKKYVHQEQVDLQGLALARLLGESSARVGFIYPRLTKCDEPELTTLNENALDLLAGDAHELMRRLPVAQPEPGEWCWRCDARPACPAFQSERASEREQELEAAGFFA